jgi:hypothetical protein
LEGISVKITGAVIAPSGLKVNTQSFGAEWPPGVGQKPELSSPLFFDVSVEGALKGKATVYITHKAVTGKHNLHHWDDKGKKWTHHPENQVSKNTISAEFDDVAQLHGTPIVIGTLT